MNKILYKNTKQKKTKKERVDEGIDPYKNYLALNPSRNMGRSDCE